MKKIPLIIDNDARIDDLLAILMVSNAENIDLKAITLSAGNENVNEVVKRVLKITQMKDIKAEISVGTYPLMKISSNKHELLDDDNISTRNAVEVMYEQAVKANGNLHILVTGPLTNVALLLATYPNVHKLISHITIMGGAIRGGNATPCAEFNMYSDAEAGKLVLNSGVPITLITTDICDNTPIKISELDEIIQDKNLKDLIKDIDKTDENAQIYDVFASATVIKREVLEYGFYFADVETKGEFTYGKTIVDLENLLKRKPNVFVPTKCDKKALMQIMKETIK